MLYFTFYTRDVKTLYKCCHLGSKSTNAHLMQYAISRIKIHLHVSVAFATINRVLYRNIWYNTTSAQTAHVKPLSVNSEYLKLSLLTQFGQLLYFSSIPVQLPDNGRQSNRNM